MGDKKHPSSLLPIWGIFIVFFGVILLLQTLNIMPWGIWQTLFRFWPALIIIFGLWLLLGRRYIWILSFIVVVLLAIFLGVAILQLSPNTSSKVQTEAYSIPVGTMATVDVSINFSAGRITTGALISGSPNFIEANPEKRRDRSTLEGTFQREDTTGKIALKTVNQMYWGGSGVLWQLSFCRDLPFNLRAKLDAATVNFDLTDINVQNLDLVMGVSSGKLTLPGNVDSGVYNIHIDVSNLDIIVPAGIGARIKADANVSVFVIDRNRFSKAGDYWISQGCDSAAKKITVNITCDVGRVSIK